MSHLSAGDLLREEVARGSPQGQAIQEMMREGRLVPPVSHHTHTHNRQLLACIISCCEQETTIGLLKSAILSRPEAIGFLIDGFPRELAQAHMFEKQVSICTCKSTCVTYVMYLVTTLCVGV